MSSDDAEASVAIDGSKFKAVNNRDKNFTRAKMQWRMAQIEESVARYLHQFDSADQQEPGLLQAVLQLAIGGPQESSALARRIIAALSEPSDIEGHQIVTGVSAGIAVAPADGETSDQLLKNADMALYRAKEEGRNRFRFFEPSMDIRLRARHALERDFAYAGVIPGAG